MLEFVRNDDSGLFLVNQEIQMKPCSTRGAFVAIAAASLKPAVASEARAGPAAVSANGSVVAEGAEEGATAAV